MSDYTDELDVGYSGGSELVTIHGVIRRETMKAYLVQIDPECLESGKQLEVWFPKSQVEIIRYVDTHEVQIVASAWICGKKEGLAEFAHREPVPEWPPVDSKQNVDLPY